MSKHSLRFTSLSKHLLNDPQAKSFVVEHTKHCDVVLSRTYQACALSGGWWHCSHSRWWASYLPVLLLIHTPHSMPPPVLKSATTIYGSLPWRESRSWHFDAGTHLPPLLPFSRSREDSRRRNSWNPDAEEESEWLCLCLVPCMFPPLPYPCRYWWTLHLLFTTSLTICREWQSHKISVRNTTSNSYENVRVSDGVGEMGEANGSTGHEMSFGVVNGGHTDA